MYSGYKLIIFNSLMKIYRSHIFRTMTIYMLMAGFMVHLLMPFSSSAQKSAFTKWLDHNVVNTGNDHEVKVRSLIRDLHDQSGDFNHLLQQASELVSNHRDHFRIHFSFDANGDQQNVSSWLVGQWNVFQNHQNGSNAILPELYQPIHKWISPNSFNSTYLNRVLKPLTHTLDSIYIDQVIDKVFYHLTPLVSGISINAP